MVAKEDGGPRADPSMPRAERDKYDNLIILCPTHHLAVVDPQEEEWTVEKLLAMKATHEEDVARRLGQVTEPSVVLGAPKVYPDELADLTHLVPDPQYASSGTTRPPLIRVPKERVSYELYRVPVTSEGQDASDVSVQLAGSKPLLQKGLPNPILHVAGDNPTDHVTFSESKGFALANGIPRQIDVIAITKTEPYRCFIFSVASDDAMEEHAELDGEYVFQLAATGGASQEYKVQVNLTEGTLSMVPVSETAVAPDFWLEPGAPSFRVNPGAHEPTADTVKLLMTFTQVAGDEVTPVIEWSGAAVEPSQPLMMRENQPHKFQLRPALARPTRPADEVMFDIRFRWQGATRQYRWVWPLYIRDKGIWGMHNDAENTNQPAERTTLD